jgi:hypothetical protein
VFLDIPLLIKTRWLIISFSAKSMIFNIIDGNFYEGMMLSCDGFMLFLYSFYLFGRYIYTERQETETKSLLLIDMAYKNEWSNQELIYQEVKLTT